MRRSPKMLDVMRHSPGTRLTESPNGHGDEPADGEVGALVVGVVAVAADDARAVALR